MQTKSPLTRVILTGMMAKIFNKAEAWPAVRLIGSTLGKFLSAKELVFTRVQLNNNSESQ